MKIALILLSILSYNSVFSQEDSIYTAIFISPLEDLEITDSDSLGLIDEPLLIDELQLNFQYTFFISGIDTLLTSEIEISFSALDSVQMDSTFTMSEIDSLEELERIEDTVLLPFGVFPLFDAYDFTAILKDSEGNIIESRIDSFFEE